METKVFNWQAAEYLYSSVLWDLKLHPGQHEKEVQIDVMEDANHTYGRNLLVPIGRSIYAISGMREDWRMYYHTAVRAYQADQEVL